DNAAYHGVYMRAQSSEWARRAALRPPSEQEARLGSETYHEQGLALEQFDSRARRLFGAQQERLWRDAFAHALKWRGTERERTWRVDGQDGPARAPDLLGPPSCLRSVGMLLGSRSGAPHKSGGPSAAGEFRAWLRDTLARRR